ncbi:MAG: DUF899 family protein [Actinomycetota bacterium]
MTFQPSDVYAAKRQELLEAELTLMRQREAVAELRRGLPIDSPVEDYSFVEGPADLGAGDDAEPVKLSSLFSAPDRTLIVYHFMFGKAQTQPCPMCTMWTDGYNAVAPHVAQRVDFAVLAAADIGRFRTYARSRDWNNLRLLSADESTFKRDFSSEDDEGNQTPYISVFRLAPDGSVRHFYTTGAQMTEEAWRGIDLLSPVWHLFDLTPEGRDDWYPSVRYP